MKEAFDWLYGHAKIRRFMESRRQKRELERSIAEAYARLFPNDKEKLQ